MTDKIVDQLNVPESHVRLTTTFSPDVKTTKFDLVVPGQPVMKTGMTYGSFELTLENLKWLRNTLTKYIGDDLELKTNGDSKTVVRSIDGTAITVQKVEALIKEVERDLEDLSKATI